jgi:hypothetical protein
MTDSSKEQPYLHVERTVVDIKYNPNYGDRRLCKCGHTYYRHFDSYDEMFPCGCKYCQCYTFEEDPHPEDQTTCMPLY